MDQLFWIRESGIVRCRARGGFVLFSKVMYDSQTDGFLLSFLDCMKYPVSTIILLTVKTWNSGLFKEDF